MLLIIAKSISRTNNKYMKDYNKNKKSSYLKYWDVNNLYGWEMSQKLLVNDFKWVEDIPEINRDFIKAIMIKVTKDVFLKLMFNIPKLYITFTTIYPFCLK